MSGKETVNPVDEKFRSLLGEIIEFQKHNRAYEGVPFKDEPAYKTMKTMKGEEKVRLMFFLADYSRAHKGDNPPRSIEVAVGVMFALLRTNIMFSENDFFDFFRRGCVATRGQKTWCPFGVFINQIGKYIKKNGLSDKLKSDIIKIQDHEWLGEYWNANGKATAKLAAFLVEEEPGRVATYPLGDGRLGAVMTADRKGMTAEEQDKWNAVFFYCATATTGKPSQKWLKAVKPLVDSIGTTSFKKYAIRWLNHAAHLDILLQEHQTKWGAYVTGEYLEDHLKTPMKGLLWSMSRFHDRESLQVIALLAENCFQKIPGQGPAATAVGNAAIYTLAQSKGLEGVSHLSRLKLRIRQNNTQKLIQGYIEQQAAKLGLKAAQIEEIAAPDFGLVDGEKTEEFKDFTLRLSLTGIGKTALQWIKPDGGIQKSVPAFVKDSKPLTAKLKKLRATAAEMKKASTTQRDRIDRLYVEDMSWNVEDFEKYYLHHGLVSQIAEKLVWKLDGVPALYADGSWQDVAGKAVKFSKDVKIALWHPIESTPEEVLAWRDHFEKLEIQQPFKQAWREVYPLTEAEVNTATYSNRMAAHFLKQHQFNSLAALRGWKYSLLGAYDDGRDDEIARKALPSYKLEAQFWIDQILDDNDSFNEVGIWHYVATDQVRFNNEAGEAVPLIDVPKLIFSEIMRDVDLFVGVASVGNDPTWQDGGPNERPAYRDYWQTYSFGDLNEVAKTRKTVLERLLPRLKIRDIAHIEGKFLMVDGKRHTYKIHIGSGNILIAPNDKYLCIVPGRGKDKNLAKIFLPFEGDNGLSIVLSKAFMLAEDDKITDQTILSQL